MELLKAWSALVRRKWLFLQAVVFFTVGAAVLAVVLPKRFEAASKISVEASESALSILGDLDLGEMAQSLSGSSDDMQTKIALAQVRPVLEEVRWRLQLRDWDGELLPAEKLLVPGIDGELLAYPWIRIEQAQGTNLLVITATADNPELAALLADTMVEVYLQVSQDREKQDTRDALGFVDAELGKLKVGFDEALKNVADAQAREQVIDLDSELKAAVGRVSELLAEVKATDAELAALGAQVRERQRQNLQESAERVSPASTSGNPVIQAMRTKLQELRLERKKQLLDKTGRHPDILLLDQQISAVEAELTLALQEQHELDPIIETLRVTEAGLEKRRVELKEGVDETVRQFGAYPEKMREIAGLQLAADATQNIYKALLEQQYQIAVANAMTVTDMKAVEPAKAPDKPAAPKLLVYVVLGVFVGMAMGVSLVFLAEYVDDSVKDHESLRETWSVPVLGVVPRFKLPSGGRLVHEVDPTDPIYEAFRSVRNGVAFSSVDAPVNILGVTSCVPSEGKSTVVTNLGIVLANDGQRAIIVDCDLRRPAQHRAFPEVSNAKGLSNVLGGECSVEEAIQETPVPGLHLLSSGPLPANPGRLVESLRLRQVLAELARSYAMVLVDAPPLLVVGDAIALARASRGLLVVVEAGRTPRRMVTDLKNRLEAADVEATGVVLNKVDVRTGNFGYYHQYAAHYGADGRSRTAKRRGA
jgi:capsular exopolysaccharide synthesis family protein